jgi:hypothetical protein
MGFFGCLGSVGVVARFTVWARGLKSVPRFTCFSQLRDFADLANRRALSKLTLFMPPPWDEFDKTGSTGR